MKNRKLLLIVSIVLALTMSLGGTLAYLTDTDADVNTMVLGNVKIEQIEQERDANGNLVAFTQDKPLIPAVIGEFTGSPWADSIVEGNNAWCVYRSEIKNVVDKFVTVKNTGNTSAYVRTIIAFEGSRAALVKGEYADYIYTAYNISDDMVMQTLQDVQINGNTYQVKVFTYTTPLAKGETTDPSLKQVYLDKDADNEQVQALDGNKNGKYDILVLSQAVQADGFEAVMDGETVKYAAQVALEAGFGEISAQNVADWFEDNEISDELPVVVADSVALSEAIADGSTYIALGDGNYIIPDSAQGKTLTIIGNGDTVIATQDDGSYEGCDYSLKGSNVTFDGVVINTNSATYTGYAYCKGTYNNCTINGTFTLYDDSVFNNCTFNVSGDVYNIWTWGATNVTFNNCTFNSDGKALLLYGTVNTKLTVADCVFNDNGGLTDKKAAIEIGNDYGKSYELIVNNTVVNGYEINDNGINTGTTLWANKNSMSTEVLNVVVDGVDVY